jgi:hypothetical protein
MVYIFGWMPSNADTMPLMKALPSWFYSFMDTTSTGWNIKSVPRWYRDMSYDPSLGGSRHIIYGNAYGASNNTNYYRPDSTWRYYSQFNNWYAQFQYDIIRKADQDIDFSQFTGPGQNDSMVQECCFYDKDNVRQGNWAYGGSGIADIGFGTYVTNDYKNGHHVIVQQGTSLHSLFEWPVPPGWPDQEQRNALGSGVHEYMHHFSNGGFMNHQYDDEGNGQCFYNCPDTHPETWSWGTWGVYDPGFGWGFIGEADPFMKVWNNWGAPLEVDTICYLQHIHDFVTTGEMFKLPISVSGVTRGQYFLVTNHQRISAWEDTFPGKGIVLNQVVPWHAFQNGQLGNYWEMQKMTDIEAATGLWDSTGVGTTANPDSGWDACDFYSNDTSFNRSHNANQGVQADIYSDQPNYGRTIFDGLSNPNSNAYVDASNYWFDEGKYPQTAVTHLAVYNIHQDPSDSAVMIADLLVNNWYGQLPPGKTTWGEQANMADRHYVLTGDLTINENDTLVIKQGTRVDVYPTTDNQQGGWYSDKTEIIVKGTLIIEQDVPPMMVQFTSNGEYPGSGDWGGIRVDGGSVSLSYCTVKDAVIGVCFVNDGSGSVSSSTIENMSDEGVDIQPGSSPTISYNTIHDFGYYGILVFGGDARITGNQVTTDRYGDGAYGLVAMSGYSGEVDQNVFAYTGSQMWNWSQWGMYLSANDTSAYYHHNEVYGFGQGGVYDEYGSPLFQCENVHDNMYNGLYCYYYASPTVRHGRYKNHYNGVYATEYSWPDLSAPDTLEGNSFLGYDYHAVNANGGLYALTAENCYWDSVPPDANKFSGYVDYDPYLNSEPPACSPPGGGGPQDKGGIQLQLPKVYALGPAIPNPSNGQMRIIYQLPKESMVNFRIYNVMGQLVRTLRSGKEKAGYYTATWDGKDAQGKKAGAGVYFYRLDAGEYSKTKKLVIVR